MKLSDLIPFPVFISWEGQPIELKPFCLRSIVWAERFFFDGKTNGLERMNSILANAEGQEVFLNSVIDIVYYLGEKDFTKIGVESVVDLKTSLTGSIDHATIITDTITQLIEYRQQLFESHQFAKAEILSNEIDKAIEQAESLQQSDILGIISEFKTAVEQVIAQSFPDPKKEEPEAKGGSIYEALKAQNRKQTGSQKHEIWDQIYIEFYRAGGSSVDEFMNLTMRQIQPLLNEIRYKESEKMSQLTESFAKRKFFKAPQRILPEMDFTAEDVENFGKIHAKLVEEARIH